MILPFLALSTAGMLAQAYGQVQQGKAQRQAANYAAYVSEQDALAYEQNAQTALENSARGVEDVRRSFVQQNGDMIAAFAANGMDVNSSTALSYLAQGARDANYDANIVRANYATQWRENTRLAEVNRQNAQYQRISGKNAYNNSRLAAAGTIIGGLGNFGLMFSSSMGGLSGSSSNGLSGVTFD